MIPTIIGALTVAGALLHLLVSKTPRSPERVAEVLLLYVLVIGFGLQSAIGFTGHVFYPQQAADWIGWPGNSPFQFEVGIAHLGVAVTGLLCIFLRGGFWAATAVNASVFYFGTGIGHIRQAILGGRGIYDAGPALICDFLLPVVALGLLTGYMSLIAGRSRAA